VRNFFLKKPSIPLLLPRRLVEGAMTNLRAAGFLALGGVVNLLPALAPAQFPPNSLDGGNTSALWLQFMGWVMGGVGTVYLLGCGVWPAVVRVLAWRPAPLPATVLRPSFDLEVAEGYGEERSGQTMAA
jgi:hypothetical protein